MKLADYLKSEGLRPSHLAAMIGVPASTVTRLANGENKNPTLDLMKKIAKISRGAVTPNDFAGIKPAKGGEGK